MFDAMVEGTSHSDAITTGVLGTNREFAAAKPDPAVMAEIATAGESAHFTSAREAAAAINTLARQSANTARESWQRPLWPRWELWAVLASLLCLEWMLRRKGNAARATVAALGFAAILLPGETSAQATTSPPNRDIPAFIQQLGDPKVRLRDEAEAALRDFPAAAPALLNATTSHPSEEARVRARKIIDSNTRNRSHLAADLSHGHLPGYVRPPLLIAVSNDQKRFLTQGQDHACIWDTATFNPVHQVGKSNGLLPGWEGAAPVYAFAISPDGSLLAVLTGGNADARQLLVSTRNLVITDMVGISKDSHNCVRSFSGDGSFFHRPQSDGRILRFAIKNNRLAGMETLMRLPGHPLDMQVSDDGEMAFVGTVVEHIPLSVWDLGKRKLLWMADRSHLPVWRIVPLPDGRIACLCKDNRLRIYQKSPANR